MGNVFDRRFAKIAKYLIITERLLQSKNNVLGRYQILQLYVVK